MNFTKYFVAFCYLSFSAPLALAAIWAHENSDLPKDPAVHYGSLENGLKFAWAERKDADMCSLRLVVHVGSLHEEADEKGMAHFVEHLAFDGSKNFSSGSLIKWFQERGMAWGSDLNASTDFEQTIYKIDLPRCTPKRVEEALSVFRDFSDGLVFDVAEIEKEQGIIDMEEQDRDSPGLRTLVRMFKDFWLGTKFASQLPIGERHQRKKFTQEKFKAFYKKWYRPDNISLVMVGSFQEKDPSEKISEAFASMTKPTDPLPAKLDVGSLDPNPQHVVISEKNKQAVAIDFVRLTQEIKAKDLNNFLKMQEVYFSQILYSWQFSDFQSKNKNKINVIGLVNYFELGVRKIGVSFNLKKEDWQDSLVQALTLHQKILNSPLEEEYFQLLKLSILAKVEQLLEQESASSVLSDLLGDATGDFPRMGCKDSLNLFKSVVEKLTIEQVMAILNEQFSLKEIATFGTLVVGDFGEINAKTILAQVQEAVAKAGDSSAIIGNQTIVPFAYKTQAPTTPHTVLVENSEGWGYQTATFENGTKLHIKRNTDPANPKAVIFKAILGHGYLEYASEDRAKALLGANTLPIGGTVNNSTADFRILTLGREVSLNFSCGQDETMFKGASNVDDLLYSLEWMNAYIRDPAFAAKDFELVKERFLDSIAANKKLISAPFGEFNKLLFGNDGRFGDVEANDIESLSREEVLAWLKNNILNRCPEIVVVGDVDAQTVIEQVGQVFGGQVCKKLPDQIDLAKHNPIVVSNVIKEYSVEAENQQSIVQYIWPMYPASKKDNFCASFLLKNIIDGRVNDLLREKESIVYSPLVEIVRSRFPWTYNFLSIEVTTDPVQVATVDALIPQVLESFKSKPVTTEELMLARNPVVESLHLALNSSHVWSNILPISSGFSSPEEVFAFLNSVTHEQIQGLIISFFAAPSRVIINPKRST